MTCRLLCACVGAVLVSMLSVPAVVADTPRDGPNVGEFIESLAAPPPAALFRLRPTPRRTLAGSLLFGIHPALALLPTDKVLDAPCDHPQCRTNENVLADLPVPTVAPFSFGPGHCVYLQEGDWLKWILAHWTVRQQTPAPEQIDGYVHQITTGMAFACRAVEEPPASEDDTPAPMVEVLPMPHEDSDITCPFLRQQRTDRQTCQLADPEMGRDVLDNLKSLQEADKLLDMAKMLADCGFTAEAMLCCDRAAKLCPGSPSSARALAAIQTLARDSEPATTDTEESAEEQPDEPKGECSSARDGMTLPSPRYMLGSASAEPGAEAMVCGLMKACHLLVSQGMHHQAAELARQAYALDPQRVMADPLIYKMHLLAESLETPTAGANEASEPPTCPYCGCAGKPIREIVPETKKDEAGSTTLLVPPLPAIDYEVVPALDRLLTESAKIAAAAGSEEASEEGVPAGLRDLIQSMLENAAGSAVSVGSDAGGGLRVFGDCSLGGNVYHLRYTNGCLAVWKTPDAGKTKP